MNLIRWLAAGRSINAAKDGPTRYKMVELELLPKFSPGTRPKYPARASAGEMSLRKTETTAAVQSSAASTGERRQPWGYHWAWCCR